MSTIYDITLVSPHGDLSRDKAVEKGLTELGFKPVPDQGAYPEVWTRLGLKLPGGWSTNIEEFLEQIRTLPWKHWGVPSHLTVVWTDEHSTEDDSFAGRVSPYAAHVETLVVP